MIKNGVQKVKPDHRDFSFSRTFGSITPDVLPDNYNCDAGFGFPDQNALGLGLGCTGFAQSELCQDEDVAQYNPRFTYDVTLIKEGHVDSQGNPIEEYGCDIRDSLQSTIDAGVQGLTESTDDQALIHKRGAYYNIEETTDYFDAIRNALWLNRLERRSVSFCTPWYAIFGLVNQDGILSIPPTWDTTNASWHNSKVCGWKTINGVVYLVNKSWQGSTCGDGGYVYMSRPLINGLLAVSGSGAFTLGKASVAQLQLVELGFLQKLVSLYYQLLKTFA